ncbi:nucleotide-binding universal stress UspA family protein [Kitasatospora cineracea]|uniref:Nucleotide-binding universal stress UspA family protein n=2 Tax=Kitasatospora cineracea TaxID=88074 RepID=A0A8G1UKZ5_9ACTN|nr:nucleotide-binding universal stress UspA family protein [Kitasatospora cineracea]
MAGVMAEPVRVVVGVSGSLGSLAALHRAVAEARRAVGGAGSGTGGSTGGGAEVLVLHAWEPPGGEFGYRRSPCPPLLSAVRAAAEERLAEALAEAFGGADPGVPVTARTVRGEPAAVLLAAADRPGDLLVLGPSGPWWHRGLHRPVPTRCVRAARCPVLVVPRPELALVLDGLSGRGVDAELRGLVGAGRRPGGRG